MLGLDLGLMQDWYDVGPSGSTRQWPQDGENPSPFKLSRSPLRDLPSCDDAYWIRPDPAHTYAINGWGKDLVASSIIVLLYMGVFAGRSFQSKLDEAFGRFKTWCRIHHKTSSLTEFSLKTFKITSLL